jgi:hypothetical protein
MPSQPTIQELSALCLQLYDAPLSEVKQCRRLRDPSLDKSLLLRSFPVSPRPSHRPLHLLYTLLTEVPGQWPTFDLVTCHTRVLKSLPESVKAGANEEFAWLLKATSELVKQSYGAFSDFIWNEPRPALRTTKTESYITHQGLRNYVDRFRLPAHKATSKPTVAIALQNGPLLAATCIAVTTYYTSAPINPAAGAEQFRADVRQSGATFILTSSEDFMKLHMRDWATSDGVRVLFVDWDNGDGIALRDVDGHPLTDPPGERQPNKADDIGLILFTSGTSGTKKVVPLTIHSIVAGIVFVIDSWGLTTADVCLNMMPLYHV